MEDMSIILPAEWVKQSAVQLTWPHEETDWAQYWTKWFLVSCPLPKKS